MFWNSIGRLGLTVVLILAAVPAMFADDPRAAAVSTPQKVILVLGDSLAAGHGLEPEQAFPALLQDKLKQGKWDFRIVNAGVSGDTSAGGLRRLDWLLHQKADLLLLELGGNDGLRGIPPEATKTNLQAIIDRFKTKHPEARVVILGMKMPSNMGPDYTEKFEKIFPELAVQNRLPIVSFLLEGVGGKPELNLPDRIHPNAEGQKIVAENVWKVLEPLLKEMRAESDRAKPRE